MLNKSLNVGLIIGLFMALITGCSSNSGETLKLNDGSKWEVNAKMMTYILNMESLVNEFNSTDSKDYVLLSKELQSNLDLLIANCTMKGEAHDVLHQWLLPFIDLVKGLSDAEEKDKKNQFEKIQKSFKTFNEYFQ
jgi:Na+-transporting NADH:ubiquinone oxidoreductase subunit NqrD